MRTLAQLYDDTELVARRNCVYHVERGTNGKWYAVFRSELALQEYEIEHDHFDGCKRAAVYGEWRCFVLKHGLN